MKMFNKEHIERRVEFRNHRDSVVVEMWDSERSGLEAQPWSMLDHNCVIQRHGPWSRFMSMVPGEAGGFGGQMFNLTMTDGSTFYGGAWSSRSGVINRMLATQEQVVPVHTMWPDGNTGWGTNVSLKAASRILSTWRISNRDSLFSPQIAREVDKRDGEIHWEVIWSDSAFNTCKDCRGRVIEFNDLVFAAELI